MSKYGLLRTYLEGRKTEAVPMTFAEIEGIVGFKLPKSQVYPAWWSNNPTNNVMTNEWLAAGYKTEQVDIEGKKLVFRKVVQRGKTLLGSSDEQGPDASRGNRRSPLIGFMKGMITVAPGVDLTEPADPEWGEMAWGDRSGRAGGD